MSEYERAIARWEGEGGGPRFVAQRIVASSEPTIILPAVAGHPPRRTPLHHLRRKDRYVSHTQ